MDDPVKQYIESLQREFDRHEWRARYWETPGVLTIDDNTGRKLNEELATKHRKWAQELRELIKSLES